MQIFSTKNPNNFHYIKSELNLKKHLRYGLQVSDLLSLLPQKSPPLPSRNFKEHF